MRLGSIVAQFVDGALVHGHISEMALVPAAAWPIDMDVALIYFVLVERTDHSAMFND